MLSQCTMAAGLGDEKQVEGDENSVEAPNYFAATSSIK